MPIEIYLRHLYLNAFVSQSLEAFSFSVAVGSFDLLRIWAVALGLKTGGTISPGRHGRKIISVTVGN